MTIAFDDASAQALSRATANALNVLLEQGSPRRSAVETAMDDFSGGYARLLNDAAGIESGDRGRLVGVLAALDSDLRQVQQLAQQERQRQNEIAAWADRQQARQSDEAQGGFQALVGQTEALFDPQPSQYPVVCPPLNATFAARGRVRVTGGNTSGTSSADPDKLRKFVSQSKAATARLAAEFSAVRNAWASFASSCSWVPLGSVTFIELVKLCV